MEIAKKAIGDIIGPLLEKEFVESDYPKNLQSEFGMDSIVLVEVIIGLEETFNLEFEDTDLIVENFESIDAIYNNLMKYKGRGLIL